MSVKGDMMRRWNKAWLAISIDFPVVYRRVWKKQPWEYHSGHESSSDEGSGVLHQCEWVFETTETDVFICLINFCRSQHYSSIATHLQIPFFACDVVQDFSSSKAVRHNQGLLRKMSFLDLKRHRNGIPSLSLAWEIGKGVEYEIKRFRVSSENQDKNTSERLPLIYIMW